MRYYTLITSTIVIALSQVPAISDINRDFYKTDQEIDRSLDSVEGIKNRGSVAQRASLNAIMGRISELAKYSGAENISYLGESLRKLSSNNIYQIKERFEVYDLVQQKLLSIPGHAQYFADKIEKERAELKPEAYRGTYDFNRRLAFETLSHLPSPETIKVLGNYLDDSRDAAKEAMWDDTDGTLWGMDPNCERALAALRRIGLRDPGFVEPESGAWPSSEHYATRDEERRAVYEYLVARREMQLKPWRAWYAEIKTGKRAFSFKGQSVEYRFNPDGTWKTIAIANPPDDVPKPPKAGNSVKDRNLARTPPAATDKGDQERRHLWLWIMGFSVALLSALIWFRAKKSVN